MKNLKDVHIVQYFALALLLEKIDLTSLKNLIFKKKMKGGQVNQNWTSLKRFVKIGRNLFLTEEA